MIMPAKLRKYKRDRNKECYHKQKLLKKITQCVNLMFW